MNRTPGSSNPPAFTLESDLDARSDRLCRAYDPDRFARDSGSVTALVRDYLARMATREDPVWPAATPDDLLERWPDHETAPAVAVPELLASVLADSTHQHHPGFVGQQLSAPLPLVGPVAMVAALLNNSAAIFQGAPVAVVLERRVIEWMNRKAGFGAAAGGVLTSGGTLGALTALLAMRQARIGGDAWKNGLAGSGEHAVLMSAEAHYCNTRACAILGLGERAVIPVATDASFAMDLAALASAHREALAAGRRVVAVIANAGSTATGSHDDLRAIAAFCERHGLWLHVDAAHGGGALLCAKYAALLQGIERADSVVWDAHKMMLMPSLCTAVLFRNSAHLDNAFSQRASYLLSDDGAPWHEPAARSFETTKPALVLPLYVSLRALGEAFFAEHVEYAYDLARAFADELQGRADFELLTRPQGNIVCFRRRTSAGESDALQLRLRETVNRRGRFFIMRARVRGAVWLRVVLMNPATRLTHLRELLDELAGEPA
jgi:L-2,4-diaminobutyrate decarboxylase